MMRLARWVGVVVTVVVFVVVGLRACSAHTKVVRSVAPRTAPEVLEPLPVRTTPTSLAESGEAEGRGVPTAVQQRWPVTAHLPQESRTWRIDYRVDQGRLVLMVRLLAFAPREPGRESYQDQLARYKAQVLAWLDAQNTDPRTYVIEWNPPEAGRL